jgi:hypothetical protein
MRLGKNINWTRFAASLSAITPYGVFFGPDGAIYSPDGELLVPAKDEPKRSQSALVLGRDEGARDPLPGPVQPRGDRGLPHPQRLGGLAV